MKLLINTSTLCVGGGVQVSVSFINELRTIHTNHEFHIFLSKAIAQQIEQKSFSNKFYFYQIEKSPSSLKVRNEIIGKLNHLEEQISPDVVFSIFGPSYWRPKAPHLLGFADPWVLNKKSSFYSTLSVLKQLRLHLTRMYKAYYTKRDADYYVIETLDGKNKLAEIINEKHENIFVIGNTYSSAFNHDIYLNKDNQFYIKLPEREEREYRLLLISHNHHHKNIKIIRDVIPLLDGFPVKFILTIDGNSFKELFQNNKEQIINIGPVAQKSCPSLYAQSDAMFLPTLLEVFSASYPEAMVAGKPILTSNYSFAKDVCQDAALYFDPLNPKDIAEKIKMLMEDKVLENELVKKGEKRVKQFETAKSRAEKYIALCEKIVKQK